MLQPIEGLCVILQPFKGLQMLFNNPSKDLIFNPSKGWRIAWNVWSLRNIVSAILQPFEGLKDVIQSLRNPSRLKDCLCNPSKNWRTLCDPSKDWRTACESACNPSKRWMIAVYLKSFEGFKDWRIARNASTLEGLWVQSFNFEGSLSQCLKGMQDCTHNPSKDWRIVRSPSKGWMITFMVLRRVKGLCLQQDFLCSASNGWNVTLMILRRVEALHFQFFEGLKDRA